MSQKLLRERLLAICDGCRRCSGYAVGYCRSIGSWPPSIGDSTVFAKEFCFCGMRFWGGDSCEKKMALRIVGGCVLFCVGCGGGAPKRTDGLRS